MYSRRTGPDAGMTAHSTLDSESFQNLLARAFVVQEGLTDAQSRSAIVELLHLMVAGELDVDGAMHLIANRARNVANATGVAIGLVKGDQLVYHAGSGSAATYIGRHVRATLRVSANIEARQEILRVENAQTDAGIGAAICRQFGTKSILILPIYHARALAGVLEVFFSEAHAFQDREVYTYQLMARVVEKAICVVQHEQNKSWAAVPLTMSQALEQITPQMQRRPSDSRSLANKHAVFQTCEAVVAEAGKLPSKREGPAGAATMITYRPKRVPSRMRLWKVVDRAAVVTVLVTASWIAYSYRFPASPLGASERRRSNAIKQQVPFVPQKLVSANKDASKPQTASNPMEQMRARRTPQRVRIGDDEVNDISEDVTVRYFSPKPTPRQVRVGDYQIDYVSEDVTVRRFIPKVAVASPK